MRSQLSLIGPQGGIKAPIFVSLLMCSEGDTVMLSERFYMCLEFCPRIEYHVYAFQIPLVSIFILCFEPKYLFHHRKYPARLILPQIASVWLW